MIGYLYVEPNNRFYAGISIMLIIGAIALGPALKKKNNPDPEPKLFGLIPLRWRFELTKFKFVRNLFKSRWFQLIGIIINLFIFAVIIFADYSYGIGPGNYNFGIVIVWILWWILLMVFMVPIVGWLWCSVCPFPLIGDWIQRGRLILKGRDKPFGLGKKWPTKWGNLWPLVIFFWIATWGSGFFTVRPIASFILLGTIIGLAIIISLIFEKKLFAYMFAL